MAFRVPGQGTPGAGRPVVVLPRWPRYVIPAVLAVIAAAIVISILAGIWTDYLWYKSVGQGGVFTTTYGTRWLLFGVGAAFMIAAVGVNVWLAYRMRPEEPPAEPRNPGVEAYRQAIDPHRRGVAIVVLAVIGLIAGLTLSGNWQTWLLFSNRTSFGVKDAQFHLDLSFYVMVYPFLRLLLSFLFAAVLISIVLAGAVHLLYGGLRLARHSHPTVGARIHLFVLGGLFVGLKALAYWVDRYEINFSQRGVVQTGASYTDVNAVLPAKTILAVIALICALLFLAGAIRRSPMLPGMGFGLLVLSAVLIGGVYPFIIQQFVVKPNEQVKERPYLAREINSTRIAYGVTGTQVSSYSAVSSEPNALLAQQALGLPDTRLLDPGVVSAAFQQLQQVKGYYQFPAVLAFDRYRIGSGPVPVDQVVSVRDMSGPPAGQVNWINTHLVYTHGYGFVSAAASQATADGNPPFSEADIPPSGSLGTFQPRVYFGNENTGYVIVGGSQTELDYPNGSSGGQQNNTYHGGGGVPMGSFLNQLLYAVKFRDLNIMLSGAITGQSRIIYNRDPISRVAKVAPFLTLDGDAYPVIAGGQLTWVIDGYTTTDNYPYSKRIGLPAATANSYNPNGSVFGPAGEVNYIRNSVKATVNAYTGAVHIYQWGQPDPILQTWMKVFPGLISPHSAIPAALLPHLRYPEVLFSAQRQILTQFHVLQPAAFYGGQNFWSVPNDPTTAPSQTAQPPYYLTMTMPGDQTPKFSLSTVFTQRGRSNLAAFMAVNSDPTSPGYGQIRILQLPQNASILGPQQVQNNFEADTAASQQLSLFRQGGSKVVLGNLVTLPLGGGLISIEPVYIQASSAGNNGAYPQLKRIFTYYNGNVGFDPTLAGSLAQIFGATPTTPGGGGGGGGGGGTGGQVSAAVQVLLQQAEGFYQQAQQALKAGDLATYAADIAKMKTAIDQALKAAQTSSASSSPKPGASPKSSATPSPSASG